MMSIVLITGLAICGLYWCVNTSVPLPTRRRKEEKVKMGTGESLEFFLFWQQFMLVPCKIFSARVPSISLFDPCKEMAYIPLDKDTTVKGKDAIDVACNPLGKSSGTLIQQDRGFDLMIALIPC
ncbi:hypothetical protein MLD38_030687 [Melastoma candidum]|uniref:Uncharacterized protein n=1 Tax=Melastoma candidum TaxID=119954 RepID=A0ACB9MLX0_9MYRT|nr:hypothetical protein MLD38_030687 [Melastoma candidum]